MHRTPLKCIVNPILRKIQFWTDEPWVISSICKKDENGHIIYETEYLKDNEWGFKDYVPYRKESHMVWRKTEKGLWDLYTPMYKIDCDDGTQQTVYQEAPKEFLTGETNE